MAQRRMFSPDIVDSEEFKTMPVSSQALYFHLGMHADDDGFVQPKMIMRSIGFTDDDLKVLLAKRFLLTFESGVVVIKHWLIHNMIRTDRYKPTRFLEEKKSLFTKENKAYTDKNPLGCQNDNQMAAQVSIGKVNTTASNDADSKKTSMEYTEPVIQLDEDGEEIAPVQPHSGRFGKYTRLVAQHYADKQNKVVTGQTMGEAKQLLVFIHSEFPEDDNASLAKEAKSAINLTAKYYAELKVENWGLLKVIENWKKI